jgi:hypothetical protein
MESWRVALIDQTDGGVVQPVDLGRYAAALQKQVDDDLAPAWDVRADISVLAAGDEIPPDTWPVKIVDAIPFAEPGESGVHLDDQGQPYATVINGDSLSITISHELLEMLVDPWGTRFINAADLDPYSHGQQVRYLVEVCDPCQISSYPVDGVLVSDFILPSFYWTQATRPVDFLDTLSVPSPQKVPLGCYISWFDPGDESWYEQGIDGLIVAGTESPALFTRAGRDDALGRTNPDRHCISAIYQAYPEDVRCLPRPADATGL